MFPDFLGIGAQKSGTTWLHHNLSQHPEIWMPPVKELHYLDRDPVSLRKRLTKKTETMRTARGHLRDTVTGLGRTSGFEDLAWASRYLFAPRNDQWYAGLFPIHDGRITGENCLGYAGVQPERVAHIHGLMPRAKIIYLMRNPIDRAWSTTVMHFNKPNFNGLSGADLEEVRSHIRAGKTRKHGDYLGNLRNWQAHYPNEQIIVGYFDQLLEDPSGLLKDLLDFLGVSSDDRHLPGDVGTRQNRGKGDPIPEEFEALLSELHYEEIELLHEAMPNDYTKRWFDDARRLRSEAQA